MRIAVVGGSGLIGSTVVRTLRERGHEPTVVARTDRPGVDHRVDLVSAPAQRWREVLSGHDGVVFAARTDEQKPLRKPIYPATHRAMVEPVARLFAAARDEGLTRGVIMGSYYVHADRLHPSWRLPEKHVYVRCRIEQAAAARASGLPVAVLELPFVFGRGTNWADGLASMARSRGPLFAPAGGTAGISVDGVAGAAVDALERASGEDLPIADENLSWAELFTRIAAAVGRPRRATRLPSAVVRAGLGLGGALLALTGREPGLNPAHLADLLLAELYIEPTTGQALQPALVETFA